MKKIVIGLAALLILSCIAILVFIPKEITVSQSIKVNTKHRRASKFLSDYSYWAKWWPKQNISADSIFSYHEKTFEIDSVYYDRIVVKINSGSQSLNTKISVIPIEIDTAAISWQCVLPSTNNPYTRWQQYRYAVGIKEDIDYILQNLQTFLNDSKNIYGLKIIQGSIQDSLLIAFKQKFTQQPSTSEIYGMIDQLKKYVADNAGRQTGNPMLNIDSMATNKYTVYVAVPIDKELPQTNSFKIKRMFPGRALVAQVLGGPNTLHHALVSINEYRLDYEQNSPAIPFQSIITDRMLQPDSTKWLTKIYYPIF